MASSTKPLLLLDCYLDPGGCPALFLPSRETRTEVIAPPHVALGDLELDLGSYSGVVITGSAASVLDELPWSLALEKLIHQAHATSLPLFGVCYGHQLIAKALFGNAQVRRSPTPEFGWLNIEVGQAKGPLSNAPKTFRCFLSHYDEVMATPAADLEILAWSDRCQVQAFRLRTTPIWGVQFHAEMDFEEARTIFVERVANSPELGIDADAMVELAECTESLWHGIYRAFLDRCEA